MIRETPFFALLASCVFAAGIGHAEEAPPKKQPAKSVPKKSAAKVPEKTPATKPTKPTEDDLATKTLVDGVERGSKKSEPLYDVAQLVPRIAIELRYATARNLAGRPIYPPDARCLVRESVAERLVVAQAWLKQHAASGTTLKIWDGYRPSWVQRILWRELPNKELLGDPHGVGSLHTWGVCVDATLCDVEGRDLKMPTDFDVFIPESGTFFEHKDPVVRKHLHWLQLAMRAAGFMVVRDEWWHFVARDHEAFGPLDVSLVLPQKR